MKKNRLWIWLGLFLTLFIIASYFLQTKQPRQFPAYVSQSPSPTGVKALYTYLEQERVAVKKWNSSPEKLPTEQKNQLLLMIEPESILGTEEMNAYIDFMESGNTILLFQHNPHGMFQLSTENVLYFPDREDIVYDYDGNEYQASVSYNNRLKHETDDEILFQDDAGTVALKRPFGKGELIATTFPDWVMNSEILEKDHIPLIIYLINEASGETILFDEYIHGEKATELFYTYYPLWFLLLIIQGAILALLWLWYRGKRFGPIFTPREATVRFSDEGIRALAAWYLRGRLYHDSIVIQADYLKHALQDCWHIPYQKEWGEIDEELLKKWEGKKKIEIQSFLSELTKVLQKEDLSKQEYLRWAKKLDRLRIEVEQR